MPFKGKNVLITGGASGIGQGIAGPPQQHYRKKIILIKVA